jgi:hypothetical protein
MADDSSVVSKLTAASGLSLLTPKRSLSISSVTIAKRKGSFMAGGRRSSKLTATELSDEEELQLATIQGDPEIVRIRDLFTDSNVILLDKTTHR